MIRRTLLAVALAATLLPATAFAVPPTDAQRCTADVEKASGRFAQCQLNAVSAFTKSGDASKLSTALAKCTDKLQTAFGKATSKYGGACPMTEPVAAFDAYLSQCSDDTAAAAAGGALPDYVGDLTSCEADLLTCQATPAAQLLKTGQTTSYGAGSDGDLQRGVAQSYVDNGDGTITDTRTGLMWEKKSDDGTINDKDNLYSWGMTTPPYTMNGTMVTSFLAGLNAGGGFAGHTDWRLPNLTELESIRNLENVNPAVSAAFNTNCGANSSGNPSCTVTTCSCTVLSSYWSSTTYSNPSLARLVFFGAGYGLEISKGVTFHVRAVRSGA